MCVRDAVRRPHVHPVVPRARAVLRVAQGRERRVEPERVDPRRRPGGEVDDRLRAEARYRGAADVLDREERGTGRREDPRGLGTERLRPRGSVLLEADHRGHPTDAAAQAPRLDDRALLPLASRPRPRRHRSHRRRDRRGAGPRRVVGRRDGPRSRPHARRAPGPRRALPHRRPRRRPRHRAADGRRRRPARRPRRVHGGRRPGASAGDAGERIRRRRVLARRARRRRRPARHRRRAAALPRPDPRRTTRRSRPPRREPTRSRARATRPRRSPSSGRPSTAGCR